MSEPVRFRRGPRRAARVRRTVGLLAIVVAALATTASSSTASADDPEEVDLELVFGDGIVVRDLLMATMRATNQPILWERGERRVFATFAGSARIRVAAGRLFGTVRGIVAARDIELLSVGSPSVAWLAVDARRDTQICHPPPYIVDARRLAALASEEGLSVGVFLDVPDGIDVAEAGAAAKRLLTSEAVGFVAPLLESRCLFVMDFAPVVARIAMVVRGLTAPAPPKVKAFPLAHARAGDVLALVNRALGAGRPESAGSSSLRLAAADASNQLIAIGTEADLARVSEIVAALDRPSRDAKPDGR